MTFIKEFRIANLAGRTGVIHYELDRTVNVFWGLNGSGKTTLLRILAGALEDSTADLDGLPFDWAEVVFHSDNNDVDLLRRFTPGQKPRKKKREQPLDWSLFAHLELDEDVVRRAVRGTDDEPWQTTVLGKVDDLERVGGLAYKHRYLPISRIVEPLNNRAWSELSADERFVRHVNTVWSRYSARSLASIRDIQQQGLAEVLAILFGGKATGELEGVLPDDDTTTPNEAYELVSRFLDQQGLELPLGATDFVARYRNDPNRHVVARIRAVMDLVDQVLLPQQELQSVIEEMYIGNKHLVLRQAQRISDRLSVLIDDEAVPVSSLSSGEKQLLHILLETLAIEDSTIMIDEPELSLHVDWQKGLVESMRRVNPGGQFILATHSPELMIDVPPECVFEL